MEEEAEAALKTGRHHPVCIIKLAARRAGEFFFVFYGASLSSSVRVKRRAEAKRVRRRKANGAECSSAEVAECMMRNRPAALSSSH
jgi:hypothetical protein